MTVPADSSNNCMRYRGNRNTDSKEDIISHTDTTESLTALEYDLAGGCSCDSKEDTGM